MTIAITEPDAALDGLHSKVDRRAVAAVRLGVPRVGGLAGLSTDVFGGQKMSHPRTSVRGEGRRT
jgi:hypothetical protein